MAADVNLIAPMRIVFRFRHDVGARTLRQASPNMLVLSRSHAYDNRARRAYIALRCVAPGLPPTTKAATAIRSRSS